MRMGPHIILLGVGGGGGAFSWEPKNSMTPVHNQPRPQALLFVGPGSRYHSSILANPCTRDIWILDQISLDFFAFSLDQS